MTQSCRLHSISATTRRCRSTCGRAPVVLTGDNGAGKTNLLEAISLLTPGRGLRRAAYADMAREGGAGGFAVHAELDGAGGDGRDRHRHVRRRAGGEGGRRVRINGAPREVGRGVARMAARRLADAGDGRAVHRTGRRPPALPRPAGAGDRSRPRPARARLREGDARPQPAACRRIARRCAGSRRSRRRWPRPASPSPRRAPNWCGCWRR